MFELPLPETTNQTYRSGKRGWYKSEKQTSWEQKAGWMLKKQMRESRVYGDTSLCMGITFFVKKDRDIDGGIKAILDLFERMGFYDNDSQVVHLNVKKFVDKKNPRCEVEIKQV